MPYGQIVKAISGFFYVRTSTDIVQCRPRGIFKFEKKKLVPLVGDFVEYEQSGENDGVITRIETRQTELTRPSIANVEQAVIISSLTLPSFQHVNVDRFLVYGEYKDVKLVICVTKVDLMEDSSMLTSIKNIYERVGYPVIMSSIYNGSGLFELQELLAGKTSVFAGESGVGKSSLLKKIVPNHDIRAGVVSQRLGRGKHTTKVVELIPLQCSGQVADTPGFSKLSLAEIPPSRLGGCFPEIRNVSPLCYYRDCYHVNEPRCEVIEAVKRGDIHKKRYESYLVFLQEIQNEREGSFRW